MKNRTLSIKQAKKEPIEKTDKKVHRRKNTVSIVLNTANMVLLLPQIPSPKYINPSTPQYYSVRRSSLHQTSLARSAPSKVRVPRIPQHTARCGGDTKRMSKIYKQVESRFFSSFFPSVLCTPVSTGRLYSASSCTCHRPRCINFA